MAVAEPGLARPESGGQRQELVYVVSNNGTAVMLSGHPGVGPDPEWDRRSAFYQIFGSISGHSPVPPKRASGVVTFLGRIRAQEGRPESA